MGTKFAPIFFETCTWLSCLYANLEKEFDCQFKQYIIDNFNFKRLMDDCFDLFYTLG